ncbi:MAG: hypothetical protein K1X53_09905 [Candidatus Sumerlaeaceae bacterium]|nr:hypothetical protein [Candidatus Sumerlaeaceae bacterium]
MKLPRFKNTEGEAVVCFEPCCTNGPQREADSRTWFHHLLVRGERIYEYGCPCGTCGILFRKVGRVEHRLDDRQAFELLDGLQSLPTEDTLRKLARLLVRGYYYPLVLEATVRRVEPGTVDDYFATDVTRLFGLEPPEYELPKNPQTPYYRFGTDASMDRTGRLRGPHKALITSVIMPLHNPDDLHRARVDFWRAQSDAGVPMTALAVGIIDNQAPALEPKDPTYPYEEQFLFTNCLLDGHHRAQAAAESGVPLRILSFLALGARSMVETPDVPSVVRPFLRNPEP